MPKLPEKPFINRIREQDFLHKHFQSIPDSILWISGPKSCGKTSLITKVLNELDLEKYAVNYLNLRGVLIYDFQSFLDVFFQKEESLKQKTGRLISGMTVNAGFFSIGLNDDVMLKKNAFKVMEDQIRETKAKGIQPILILDEIQTLKGIYLNGERRLIDEIFNLFVRLTKETHLAHVVCLTSDSYFMEEIYDNSKLAVTSTFYDIHHFDEKTNAEWLKEEGLKAEEISVIYDYFGGSPWHTWQVLVEYKRGDGELKTLCENMLAQQQGIVFEFRRYLTKDQKTVFDQVAQAIVRENFYKISDTDSELLNDILIKAIEQDIWFYRAATGKITANSRVVQKAMLNMLSEN